MEKFFHRDGKFAGTGRKNDYLWIELKIYQNEIQTHSKRKTW